jgi:hypothetical protein
MTMESLTSRPWYRRNGWLIVVVLALLFVVFGLYVLAVPVDAADFERATDTDWDAFSSASPAVADYLEREARLLGVASIAIGALVAGLAWTLVRRGDRSAWVLLWLLPAATTLFALVFLTGDATALGGFYVAITVVAVAATWVARPT